MRTLEIKDNDLRLDGSNNLSVIHDEKEETQSIERILTTNLNEWFLNPDFGFNYETIQNKNFDIEEIRFAVMEAVMQEKRVDKITDIKIEFDRVNRKILINFNAKIQNHIIENKVVI